ncbi:hypothetical protein [Streptacidiphilus neutrinimicus]|uniref:hypothetical protein n=1 Tax=Streptacidiphilus neutrinimicus TaxID=105420 RepID=UPI000A7BC215|nr:hypothetical protein [Streptacidiphilus neutrinimicus]
MTISAAVVFVLAAFLLVRSGRSTISTALVCVVAGFLLASTNIAPTIHSLLTSIATSASHV